jgi:hypothetical protein
VTERTAGNQKIIPVDASVILSIPPPPKSNLEIILSILKMGLGVSTRFLFPQYLQTGISIEILLQLAWTPVDILHKQASPIRHVLHDYNQIVRLSLVVRLSSISLLHERVLGSLS